MGFWVVSVKVAQCLHTSKNFTLRFIANSKIHTSDALWITKRTNIYPTMHLFSLFSILQCIRFVIFANSKKSHSLNTTEWKFTLISEWLLFNSKRVGFSSKRAEKMFSWSLAISSKSHSRVEWPKFHSFSEWTISQSEAPKIAQYLLGWCNKMAGSVSMSGYKKVDLMKK